jgi:hypothetical protein
MPAKGMIINQQTAEIGCSFMVNVEEEPISRLNV